MAFDRPFNLYIRLREELAERAPLEALETTVRELAAPSLTATLGPAVVFFACALSKYRGLGELGVLAGIGLILNLIAMLTVFPALLAVLPPRVWGRARKASTTGPIAALGRAAAARPRTVLLVAAALGVAALPLAMRVHFEKRLISVQPQTMPAARV